MLPFIQGRLGFGETLDRVKKKNPGGLIFFFAYLFQIFGAVLPKRSE